MSNSVVASSMRRNELASWAERQSNDSEFQTKGALTLKVFTDNASAIRRTDSNSLSQKTRTKYETGKKWLTIIKSAYSCYTSNKKE